MSIRRSGLAILALVLFAGCAPVGDVARGDGVHFNVAADPSNLNPLFAHTDAGNVEQNLAHLAFEPFFDLDQNGAPVPELLAHLPTVENGGISADARTLTYDLRPNVKWSDGVALTSRDVLFTLHAILDPKNPIASHEGYDLIDRAEALGPYRVRFHLSKAWAPAVSTFFAYGTSPQYVLPEHVLAKEAPLDRAEFDRAPTVGDGPFRFVSWTHGDRIVYAANARYWRGVPAVKRIDVRIVPDPQSNMALMQAGDLDFNLVAPAQWSSLVQTTKFAYSYAPTALIAGVAMNVTHAPLDDVRVRRAIAQSVDRRGISTKITLGRYPVAETDRPRFSFAYDATIREPAYDPSAADRAFTDAGWLLGRDGLRRKNGKTLALTYVQFPETATGKNAAVFVQRELHERGVDVTIKSISNAQLFLPAKDGGALAAGNFDLAYVPWAMGADPDDRFLLGCGDALKNYMRYCDRAVDALEARAAQSPDRSARAADYRAIDRIVARDVPILYLFNPTYIYAYRPRLTGFAPNGFTPTWNAYAWHLK